MGSIPSLEHRRGRACVQIDGSMPRLNAIPPGCAFNPRCPKVFDRCRVERPGADAGAARTQAACWLLRRGRAWLSRGMLEAGQRCSASASSTSRARGCSALLDARASAGSCARSTTSRSPSPAARRLSLVGEIRLRQDPPSRGWPSASTRRAPATSVFEGQPLSAARAQPALRRRMHMIFQDPYASLNPRWRVRDIVAEPIRAFGLCNAARRRRGPGRRSCSRRSA